MAFSGVTVDPSGGTLSGDFSVATRDMIFVGDPTALDIDGASRNFGGWMRMVGAGFGTVDTDMDHLAFHFDDATATGHINGTVTVHCHDWPT